MPLDHTYCRLCKDKTFSRTIKVTRETEGSHYLVETVNTSFDGEAGHDALPSMSPDFSWKHFTTQPDAEAFATAQYEASLKEGFTPLDS
jgi:hypothetical protein